MTRSMTVAWSLGARRDGRRPPLQYFAEARPMNLPLQTLVLDSLHVAVQEESIELAKVARCPRYAGVDTRSGCRKVAVNGKFNLRWTLRLTHNRVLGFAQLSNSALDRLVPKVVQRDDFVDPIETPHPIAHAPIEIGFR